MHKLTFVVPAAPHHEALLERALASIQAQTYPSLVVVVRDTECRGAGWARNSGLAQVKTDFVSFLDADDWLEPNFAEACLRAYDATRYIYTDWVTDRIVEAPCTPWDGSGTAHIITTLLPTNWVRHIGGFNESLPGLEDTAFYWALTRAGLCGKHLAFPLFHYSKDGKRSQTFRDRADRDDIGRKIIEPFKGKPMSCGGCGGSNSFIAPEIANLPIGEPQPGDVLAEALWLGNRAERGSITGRLYPRASAGKRFWMDPRDIDQAPHKFSRVVEMPGKPTESDFQRFARDAMHSMTGVPSQPELIPVQHAPPPVPVKADVNKLLGLYRQRTN